MDSQVGGKAAMRGEHQPSRCECKGPADARPGLRRCVGLQLLRWTAALLALVVPNAGRAAVAVTAGPWPTLRLRIAPAIHLTQESAHASRLDLALAVTAGLPIVIYPDGSGDLLSKVFVLYPELGYQYQSAGKHLFSVGTYLGYGPGMMYGAAGASLLVGSQIEGRSLGFRYGAGLHMLFDTVSIELQHQVLWVQSVTQHDLILWLGINPLQLANLGGKIH